jgi:hypothetical protein
VGLKHVDEVKGTVESLVKKDVHLFLGLFPN